MWAAIQHLVVPHQPPVATDATAGARKATKYVVRDGQVGAVGEGAKVENSTFIGEQHHHHYPASPSPSPKTPAVDVQPTYQSERDRELCEEMEGLYERKAERDFEGGDTTDLLDQILAIKRQLRSGLELVAGDRLKHRYKLLEELGRGGFATVWKAYDTRQRQHVAVKVLHGQFARSQERIDRFFRGSRYMRQLKHPHIVDIQSEEERDDDSGRPFFVMELLAGGDLWQVIQRKALSTGALFDYVQSIASALAHAHGQSIVHRDVKPANILLTAKGVAKLTDFDLVRAGDTTGGTRTGALGTFIYAAPEAFKDASKAEAAADVYGLAMTAVVGLLGRLPELVEKTAAGELVGQLDVAPPIADVLQASLQVEPKERPEHAGAFLERFKAARTVQNVAPTIITPKPRREGWEEGRDTFGIYADVIVPGTRAGFRMRWIKPGTFMMGSPEDEKGRWNNEGPQHEVTLTEGFWMADAPCTQAVYEALTGGNPAAFKEADRPVEQVSWNEAQEFLQALNERLPGDPFALPTEAQWEYACRAGTTGARYGELDAIAWYNNAGYTQPIRQKQPNAWGLYDTLGNVMEWCSDGIRPYTKEAQQDPQGPEVGDFRVIRGGSWGGSRSSLPCGESRRGRPVEPVPHPGLSVLSEVRKLPEAARRARGKKRPRKPRDGQRPSGAVRGSVVSPPTVITPKAEEPTPTVGECGLWH